MTATSDEAGVKCPQEDVPRAENRPDDTSRRRVAAAALHPSGCVEEMEGGGSSNTGKEENTEASDDAGLGGDAAVKGECWLGTCKKSQP